MTKEKAQPQSEEAFVKFGRTLNPTADPTKTKTLRGLLVADMNRRYRELKRVITQSIVDNDALGLRVLNALSPLPPKALAGLTDTEKVRRFSGWLREQVERGVLEFKPTLVNPTGDPWITSYFESSYAKGIIRGNRDVARITALSVPVTTDNVGVVMGSPEMRSSLDLEINKTWTALDNVTVTMQSQIENVLTLGLETGLSPRQIALGINDRVDAIGVARSDLIARTEIVRANNLGSINEYARLSGIVGEEILSQWQATLDSRVRSSHLARHGKIFKREEILRLLGEPNCRCAALPYIESIEGKAEKQKASDFLPGTTVTEKTRQKKPPTVKKPAKSKITKEKIFDTGNDSDKLLNSAFESAPDDLRRKIKETPGPKKVNIISEDKRSSYSASTKVLNTRNNKRVAAHEYGHSLLDNQKESRKLQGKLAEAINQDLKKWGRTIKKK